MLYFYLLLQVELNKRRNGEIKRHNGMKGNINNSGSTIM